MLDGLYPILIFTLKGIPFTPGSDPLTKKRGPIDSLLTDVGLPIPIYLHRLTGITVEDETKAVDLETVSEAVTNEAGVSKIIYDQRAVTAMTTINLLAKKDSVALSVLFAFAEQAAHYITEKKYSVDYYNGPILLRNGLLRSIATAASSDDSLTRVVIQLSKGDDTNFTPQSTNILRNTRGPVPGGG